VAITRIKIVTEVGQRFLMTLHKSLTWNVASPALAVEAAYP